MDPHMAERIRYAKAKGLAVFTITNGSLLDRKISKSDHSRRPG
jgi:wyosine [tRNA(Phe)-imidazoG37] synthetase (radical SAM superfamily)